MTSATAVTYKGFSIVEAAGRAGKTQSLILLRNRAAETRTRFNVSQPASRERAVARLRQYADDRVTEADRARTSMAESFREAGY